MDDIRPARLLTKGGNTDNLKKQLTEKMDEEKRKMDEEKRKKDQITSEHDEILRESQNSQKQVKDLKAEITDVKKMKGRLQNIERKLQESEEKLKADDDKEKEKFIGKLKVLKVCIYSKNSGQKRAETILGWSGPIVPISVIV